LIDQGFCDYATIALVQDHVYYARTSLGLMACGVATGGPTSGETGGVGYAVQTDINSGSKRRIFVPKRAIS
jgi:hypothetical protein